MKAAPLRFGGLLVNYLCNMRCGHCIYASSPHREREYITPETARRALRRIRELGCRRIHIAGGEPFLQPERLLEVLRIKGVKVVLISTDGMVPRDLRNAADRFVDLNELRPALEKVDGQPQP